MCREQGAEKRQSVGTAWAEERHHAGAVLCSVWPPHPYSDYCLLFCASELYCTLGIVQARAQLLRRNS